MIAVIDNYLPTELFQALNAKMLKRFKPAPVPEWDVFNEWSMRLTAHSIYNNNTAWSKILLGPMIPEIVSRTINLLANQYNCVNPQVWSTWYQYTGLAQNPMPKHRDKPIHSKKLEITFTSLLYAHNEWHDDWGGELCFDNTEILPKSNRLVIYSRDLEHWVNPIKHNNYDYQRMVFGMSWSTDNDF